MAINGETRDEPQGIYALSALLVVILAFAWILIAGNGAIASQTETNGANEGPRESSEVTFADDEGSASTSTTEAAKPRPPLNRLLPPPDAFAGWEVSQDQLRPNDPSPWLDPAEPCSTEPDFETIDTMENHIREWTTEYSQTTADGQVRLSSTLQLHVAYAHDATHAQQVAAWFGPFADRCLPKVLNADYPIVGSLYTEWDQLDGSAYTWREVYDPEREEFWGRRIKGFFAVDDLIIGIDLTVELREFETSEALLNQLTPGLVYEDMIMQAIVEQLNG